MANTATIKIFEKELPQRHCCWKRFASEARRTFCERWRRNHRGSIAIGEADPPSPLGEGGSASPMAMEPRWLRLQRSQKVRRASDANRFQQQCRWGSSFSNIFIVAVFAIVSVFRATLLCPHLHGWRNQKSRTLP